MSLSEEDKIGIGIALNEATLCGLEFSSKKNAIAGTFSVISLDKDGAIPDDNRVQIVFFDVGRVYASYRDGNWNDPNVKIIPFELEDLLSVTEEVGSCSIYGWDFIDCDDKNFDSWRSRLSMQYSSDNGKTDHSIDLCQEGVKRHLDIRISFGDVKFFKPDYTEISLADFVAGGRRGWDAIFAGDKAVQNAFCVYPLVDNASEKES